MKGIRKLLGGLLAGCLAITSVFIYEPTDQMSINEIVSAEVTKPSYFSEKFSVDTSIENGACFKLKNVHEKGYTGNMYLDVADGAVNYGVPLQQNTPSTDNPARNVFKFIYAGDGYYRILSTIPRDDGKEFAVDIDGASAESGAKLLLWGKKTDGYFNNQLFKIMKFQDPANLDDIRYVIVTKSSNDELVLDIDSAHKNEIGANVVQNTFSGAGTQQWYLEEVDGVNAVYNSESLIMDESLIYKFINKKTKKVMSVEGGAVDSDVNIIAEDDNGADYQKWELFKDNWNDYYLLNHKNPEYGFYVARRESPTNAILKNKSDMHTNNAWQEPGMWIKFYKNADGTYRMLTQPEQVDGFRSFLEVDTSNGNNIRDNTEFLTDDSQTWNIVTETKPAETTITTTTTTTTTTTSTSATTTTTTKKSTTTTTTTTRATTSAATASSTTSSATATTATTASSSSASSSAAATTATIASSASSNTTASSTSKTTASSATSKSTTASATAASNTTAATNATTAESSETTAAKTTAASTTKATTAATSNTTKATTAKTTKSTAKTTKSTAKTTAVTTEEATTTTKPEVKIDPLKLMRGDVDVNGVVELADVTTLSKYLLSASAYPLSCIEAEINADVTYDDAVSILDLSKLIEFNLGKISADKL